MIRRVLGLAALSVLSALATLAGAQSTTSSLTVTGKPAINKFTANTDLRIRVDGIKTSSDKRSDKLSQELKLNFGAILIDNKVNAKLTFGVLRNQSTSTAVQKRPELEVEVATIKSTYALLIPFTLIKAPFEGSGTDAKIGLRPKFRSSAVPIANGSIEGFADIEAYGVVSSRPRKVVVEGASPEDESRFSLSRNSKGEVATTEDSISPTAEYRAGVRYFPSRTNNRLKIELSLMFGQEFVRTAAVSGDNVNQTYKPIEYSDAKAVVAYNVNSDFEIRNETIGKYSGFYAKDWDGDLTDPKYTNLTGLKYTLY